MNNINIQIDKITVRRMAYGMTIKEGQEFLDWIDKNHYHDVRLSLNHVINQALIPYYDNFIKEKQDERRNNQTSERSDEA